MGFFSRLGKQEKAYTIDEAMKLIEKEFDSLEASRRDEIYSRAERVHKEFQTLGTLVKEFRKKDAPSHARGSAKVKDRFCELAAKQIESMQMPDKAGAAAYMKSAAATINSLGGLTDRQLLHIDFFFKESIAPVARKMKEISGLLNDKDSLSRHRRVLHIYGELDGLRKMKEISGSEAAKLEHALEKLEANKAAPAAPEHVDSSALLIAERRLHSAKQDIDSLLSVQKMLKKYSHNSDVNDNLIASYISSPSSALLNDEELRIVGIVTAAMPYDDTGKGGAVLSKAGSLGQKRSELLNAMRAVEEEKARYEQKNAAVAAAAMEARRAYDRQEAEIRETRKLLDDARKESDDLSSRISSHVVEMHSLASSILNAKIL